jgi:hypothetical protein
VVGLKRSRLAKFVNLSAPAHLQARNINEQAGQNNQGEGAQQRNLAKL